VPAPHHGGGPGRGKAREQRDVAVPGVRTHPIRQTTTPAPANAPGLLMLFQVVAIQPSERWMWAMRNSSIWPLKGSADSAAEGSRDPPRSNGRAHPSQHDQGARRWLQDRPAGQGSFSKVSRADPRRCPVAAAVPPSPMATQCSACSPRAVVLMFAGQPRFGVYRSPRHAAPVTG
jgi:hypothetical protein